MSVSSPWSAGCCGFIMSVACVVCLAICPILGESEAVFLGLIGGLIPEEEATSCAHLTILSRDDLKNTKKRIDAKDFEAVIKKYVQDGDGSKSVTPSLA